MNRFLPILLLSGIILFPKIVFAQSGMSEYGSKSVLATGQWFKIAVTADGIYRIDYSKLKQLGLSNLSNPRIYGNNFGQLS
jgi:hypothetical protein